MRVSSCLTAIFFAAAISVSALAAPPNSNNGSKLGTFVVVGDSLAAGFQNFSLYTSSTVPGTPPGGQQYGFAQVIAQQAGADLNLPTVTYPGIPLALYVNTATDQVARQSLPYGMRINPTQTLDLSVPGYVVADALSRTIDTFAPSPIDALALTVLPSPSGCGVIDPNPLAFTISAVQCAVQLHPDTILVSIGSNDVLQALTTGAAPTDPAVFQANYRTLLSTLAGTQARIVVTNVPDITALPFLIPAAAFTQQCGTTLPSLPSGSFVVPKVADPNFAGDVCTDYAIVPGAVISNLQQLITLYNTAIQNAASTHGALVFDLHGLLANLAQNGYKVGRVTLTTAPTGGIFSLDGIHPTNTGYAMIANEMIKTLNTQWHTGIPPVSLEQVSKTDPLFPSKDYKVDPCSEMR